MDTVEPIEARSNDVIGPVVTVGPFIFDRSFKYVRVDNKAKALEPAEAAIAECLIEYQGQLVNKDEIYSILSNRSLKGDKLEPKIVDVQMCKLRKKLGQINNGNHYITTIWGKGYLFNPPNP